MNKTFLEILGDQILKQTQMHSAANMHSSCLESTETPMVFDNVTANFVSGNDPSCITELLTRLQPIVTSASNKQKQTEPNTNHKFSQNFKAKKNNHSQEPLQNSDEGCDFGSSTGHLNDQTAPSMQPNFNKIKLSGYRLYIKENPPRKHRLDTDQWIIWNQWRKWGLSLTESFTRKDLKKAYRLLALRHHPDRATGSAAEFQQIKKDYDRLLQVFTAKA